MKNKVDMIVLIYFTLLATFPLAAGEPTPEERGLAIAQEADRRASGFGDNTADLRMILKNKHGQTSERDLRIRTLEVDEEQTRSLCIFDTPRDVKGTILLTHTHSEADDDQWLFLPALKRIRRIAAKNKSGSFMGSEYAYEDIATQELEKFTYKWLRDESYDGNDCSVIERYPIDKVNSGYTREVAWIDKSQYRTWKVDYYDRKDKLLKTLTFNDYKQYIDRFWRAHTMDMINHQTGKSTQLIWSNFEFNTGQNKRDFEKQNLTLLK